jgi:hypothetical protein
MIQQNQGVKFEMLRRPNQDSSVSAFRELNDVDFWRTNVGVAFRW